MNTTQSTVGILTLGCKVNQYESEAIAERCEALGLTVLSPDRVCDAYIVNTCTVTQEADRKSCQMIRQLHRRNPEAPVLVTGCTSQRNPERIAGIEGVCAVFGNRQKLPAADYAAAFLKNGKPETPVLLVGDLKDAPFEAMSIRSFPRTRHYIKIEDGCENRCAYCAICDARGPVRSKPADEILREADAFWRQGCAEIVLTGIETASYGRDTGDSLADVLCRIDRALPGIRVRLGSVDPNLFRPAFVEKIAALSCVAPHFHVSMQSGSSRVLARMRRGYNALLAAQAFARVRAAIPGVMFTTDMIVGFPGETEEDFRETCDFVENIGFLMTHVFPFSARKGTEAADMLPKIPEEIKKERVSLLSRTAKKARTALLDALIGTRDTVLFETCENGLWTGHTGSFVEVCCPFDSDLHGKTVPVTLLSHDGTRMTGTMETNGKKKQND